MRTAAILTLLTGLLLICAGSPALAEKPGPILVNALELDSVGNSFSGSELRLNGRPYLIGQAIEAGFLQNASVRPAVLAFSNGQVMNLAPGETVMLEPAAGPVVKCICRCGTGSDPRDTFPFSDTTQAACEAHNGQACVRGSDNVTSTLRGCTLAWVNEAPADPTEPAEPAEPGPGGEGAPDEP